MASKQKTVFLCEECGYECGKWLGRCPVCGAWQSLKEYAPPAGAANVRLSDLTAGTGITTLADVPTSALGRIQTGLGEFDRVLGGGLVPGAAVLLGGDPGIGKSTILMQISSILSAGNTVLYVTGEESAAQLKLRADRLGVNDGMLVFPEIDVERIISEARRVKPTLLIIDSIQTMCSAQSQSAPGSVTQVRESTSALMRYAKSEGAAIIIVGHVTKDGAIAGPRTLEHMVDTVLYFEGDRYGTYRILRTVKNRFGSTNEIGVFEMGDTGITEVTDPSSIFLSHTKASGCAVTVSLEGTRPIMLEVQALLSQSYFNNPRRMATGLDNNRLILLLAVLEKKANLKLYDKDVYLNVVGGMRMDERAGDLAVIMAIASAYFDVPMPEKCAVLGEVGLTGELRHVSNTDIRINECMRLGYNSVILPKSRAGAEAKAAAGGLIYVNSTLQAVSMLKA